MPRDTGKTEQQKEPTDLKGSGVNCVHRAKLFSSAPPLLFQFICDTTMTKALTPPLSQSCICKTVLKGCFQNDQDKDLNALQNRFPQIRELTMDAFVDSKHCLWD